MWRIIMVDKKKYYYKPNIVFQPGDTLREIIEEYKITQTELALRMGRPQKTINEIMNGKVEITQETALQLEKVFNIPARFWNNLESNFREYLARKKEKQKLLENTDLMKLIPINDMIKKEWIIKYSDQVEQIKELLNFFRITSLKQLFNYWQTKLVMYKQSKAYDVKNGALFSWLRKGEIEAMKISCKQYNKIGFKNCLIKIRKLANIVEPNKFIPQLQSLCSANGVAVVFVQELKGCRTSGATYWLNPTKAMILLSLRYKTNDHLWFSFFHEAAHLIYHSKKQYFIEEIIPKELNRYEEEANKFAANFMIPRDKYDNLLKNHTITGASINQFCKENEISPGIVVGRLQHDKIIKYNKLNDLKIKYEWLHNKKSENYS